MQLIISKSPLRISFAGGGTDIPNFYKKHNGAVLSTTINKYVYVATTNNFSGYNLNSNFNIELINSLSNPISREVLKHFNIFNIQLFTYSDITGRSGLGSSAAYTASLINTLLKYTNQNFTTEFLANLTCTIEIDKLNLPVGKQDQYATVYGGFNIIEFLKDDSVKINPLNFNLDTIYNLESSLFLIDTNKRRDSSTILTSLNNSILENGTAIKNLFEIKDMVYYLYDAISKNNLDEVGKILHKSWLIKKSISKDTSNIYFDDIYNASLKAGATGGKILGAGGGGFLCLYVPQWNRKNFLIQMKNFNIINFSFVKHGTTLVN